ncbi:MAG: DNA polymerase III subunit delta [Anaeroplasma sp.]
MHSYIVTTDDYQAGENKIEEIRNSLLGEFDLSQYDLEDDGFYSIIDELSTISLFDSPKFVVVRSGELICDLSDKAINELCTIMNDITSENVLVIFSTKIVDYKNEKFQKIKKYSSHIDIRIKNIPLDQYAQKTLENDGYEITPQALALLVSYSMNMSSLRNNIEILECYKLDTKKILDKDILLLIQKPLDDNIYQLIEAVLNNDKKQIFIFYNDLKILNIQPSYLISLLINKFQELYNVKILIKSNLGQADISDLFNVSSGRAYYMIKNAKKASLDEIKSNLKYLNDLEIKIKSGLCDQALGLELYFLK